MHDGRAETLEEAILWHGGEAKTAKQDFMLLTQAERDQVIAFYCRTKFSIQLKMP